MKKIKNNKKVYQSYAWGGDVDPNTVMGLAGFGGNLLGGLAGEDTAGGGFLSGAGTGAGVGASIGSVIPGIGTAIGAIGGGLVGGIAGLFGGGARAREARERAKTNRINNNKAKLNSFNSSLDTVNENPYGNLIFAKGGLVPAETINIEEGELQIDPITGKILREYTGVNPETGGLYKPHSKGKDTDNNLVTAEPGTFIVTKDTAKDYKRAVEENDTLKRNTILQNIKNAKDAKKDSSKMALGSYVDPTRPPLLGAMNPPLGSNTMGLINQPFGLPALPNVSANTGVNRTINGLQGNVAPTVPTTSNTSGRVPLSGIGDALMNYGPSLFNIGRGMFGSVDQTPNVNPIQNPYANEVLNNLPEDVNLNPLINRINRNQAAQFKQIDNTTSGNPIARANKNNIFANTQNLLADVTLDETRMNNEIRSQRGSIYNNLGQQDVAARTRAEQTNLGIDQQNQANRAAKSNLLGTGLSQLQQVYQNQRLNRNKQTMDKYKVNLLKQIFPNLKYYNDFSDEQIAQLIGG